MLYHCTPGSALQLVYLDLHVFRMMEIFCIYLYYVLLGFPSGSVVKNPPANAGDPDLIPGSGRSPGEENGYPLQYSYWENPKEREEPGGLQSMGSQKSQT